MTALLSLEGKKTDPAGWTPFIKQYISESYAESPDQYAEECTTLDQLRSQSVNIPSHPNVLTRLQQYVSPVQSLNWADSCQLMPYVNSLFFPQLCRYYAQLSQIMTKFPLDVSIRYQSFTMGKYWSLLETLPQNAKFGITLFADWNPVHLVPHNWN